ncbi:hypothetical protein L1987_54511 [Smallanthus sonchifolius]|uniref:Uncharacterized protein n=1 Tax=Smallanthus sonchifolius TaxID=185202 RepID=A0ACB9E8D1_9ASTR|nr:hypothetical protein L1987_54511 [Smallanthus sonchifolius]
MLSIEDIEFEDFSEEEGSPMVIFGAVVAGDGWRGDEGDHDRGEELVGRQWAVVVLSAVLMFLPAWWWWVAGGGGEREKSRERCREQH